MLVVVYPSGVYRQGETREEGEEPQHSTPLVRHIRTLQEVGNEQRWLAVGDG